MMTTDGKEYPYQLILDALGANDTLCMDDAGDRETLAVDLSMALRNDMTERLNALTHRAEAAEGDWQALRDFVLGLRKPGAECWCEGGPLGHTRNCQQAQQLTNPLPF